jgi:hypothetical protein
MPQPVNNNVATINLPPGGNLVWVVASVQSSGTESVTITDGNSNQVYSASGASSSGGTFTVIGDPTATFNTDQDPNGNGTYTVTLTSGCAYMLAENTISLDGGYTLQVYTFTTNDGGWPAGDNDFNDLCVQITCFGLQG